MAILQFAFTVHVYRMVTGKSKAKKNMLTWPPSVVEVEKLGHFPLPNAPKEKPWSSLGSTRFVGPDEDYEVFVHGDGMTTED